MTGKNLRKVRKAAVLSFFCDFVRKLETCAREGDQTSFYKHPNTMNLEGKRDRISAYVKDEDGVLLGTLNSSANDGSSGFTLLNVKSPKLDPNIAEGLDQWPENMLLGVQPTMQELTRAIRSSANGKAVGPDESPLSCSRSPTIVILTCAGDCSISSLVFGGGARCHCNGNMHHHGTL